MPTLTIKDNIKFFYTDSGPPNSVQNYRTVIMIHGHNFHSGSYQRLLPIAASHSIRIVCPNRRGYPGSTPFPPSEIEDVTKGTEEEHLKWWIEQGITYALFLDQLISECSLPRDGGIALAGWSSGNVFLLSILASITHPSLPRMTKERLRTYLQTFILWDAPSQLLGIPTHPDAYWVFDDQAIPLDGRAAAFGRWAAGYFYHGDISTHDFGQIDQKGTGAAGSDLTRSDSKPPTTDTMSAEVLQSVTDLVAVQSPIEIMWVQKDPPAVLMKLMQMALFDEEVQREWSGTRIHSVRGEATPHIFVWASWYLEEHDKQGRIEFSTVEGANHFLMWEDPERYLTVLDGCLSSS